MGLPQTTEARRYYRAGKQRFEDSQFLIQEERTTGAVYLAGYTIECLLKALVLEGVAPDLRRRLREDFRGRRAHDIEWLGALYRRHVGVAIPRDITRHLSRVSSWSTDLRYATGSLKRQVADEFLDSVVAITTWADGRM